MRKPLVLFFAALYRYVFRPLIFLFDSETVHDFFKDFGESLGQIGLTRNLSKILFYNKDKLLTQELSGIVFDNPIGLAAGFDYQAQLTQILPSLGFGFETIGTITNNAYGGNPKPRLGRLIKSKSLMVYKGFKNEGIKDWGDGYPVICVVAEDTQTGYRVNFLDGHLYAGGMNKANRELSLFGYVYSFFK